MTDRYGRKLYRLTKAQLTVILGQVFSVEPKKTIQSNIIGFYLYASKDFNADAMEKALNKLIELNDALRICLTFRPSGLYQFIKAFEHYAPPRVTVAGRAEFDALFSSDEVQMRVRSPRLYKALIVDCGNGAGGMYIYFHHLCCDGYSQSLMYKQLDDFYKAYSGGAEPETGKLYSVEKFFEYEHKYSKSPRYKEDRNWWRYAYNNQPRYSFPVGKIPWKCRLDIAYLDIDGELYVSMKKLCGDMSCSYSSLIMSLSALVVYKLTGDHNFALYTLLHGRQTPQLKKTVGCMYNTIPIFYDVPESLTVGQYIRDGYMDYLEALNHGRFPTANQILMAYKETYLKRFGYNHFWCVFSVMDLLKGGELTELEMYSLPITYIMGMFYCALMDDAAKGFLRIELTYQSKCFSKADAEKILNTFKNVLEAASAHPELTVARLCERLPDEQSRPAAIPS